MLRALDELAQRYPGQAVQVAAQLYLHDFTRSLGFAAIGEPLTKTAFLPAHVPPHLAGTAQRRAAITRPEVLQQGYSRSASARVASDAARISASDASRSGIGIPLRCTNR